MVCKGRVLLQHGKSKILIFSMSGLESRGIVVQVKDNEMQKYMVSHSKDCNERKCGCQLVLLVNRQPLKADPHFTRNISENELCPP